MRRMSRLKNSKSLLDMVNNCICQSVRVCVCVEWPEMEDTDTCTRIQSKNLPVYINVCVCQLQYTLLHIHVHFITPYHKSNYTSSFFTISVTFSHSLASCIVSDHNLPCVKCALFEQVQINKTELHKALLQQVFHLLSAGK